MAVTWVLFLHPRHSNVLLRRFAMAIRPQRSHTWTRYGSDTSKSLSLRNCAAPWAIWQSRSISPNRRPPSLWPIKTFQPIACKISWRKVITTTSAPYTYFKPMSWQLSRRPYQMLPVAWTSIFFNIYFFKR